MTSTDLTMSAAAAEPVEDEVIHTASAAAAAATSTEDELPLLKSVCSLRTISFSMATFCHRFHELQRHLDSIQDSIDHRSKQLLHPTSPNNEDRPPSQQETRPEPPTEIQRLCATMSGRALRKYVIARISDDIDRLRDDVSQALKCAPDPAGLVLDCIGGFYLQGSKAYTTDSPMIVGRRASILVLEFFLFSGCQAKMEASAKEDAEKAAISWRSRLVREGGIANSSEPDALGLLLFVAAFGIPSEFGSDELYDLIRLSNIYKKADVLLRSSELVERIKGTALKIFFFFFSSELKHSFNVVIFFFFCLFFLLLWLLSC